MIKALEPYFKWLCIVLFAIILYTAAYDWRDARYERAVRSNQNLALSLAQLNKMLPEGQPVITQINQVLVNNGYDRFVRTAVDTTK